jgi:hypothetical protein
VLLVRLEPLGGDRQKALRAAVAKLLRLLGALAASIIPELFDARLLLTVVRTAGAGLACRSQTTGARSGYDRPATHRCES